MKLSDYLKYERKKQKLTLVQVAKKASISYGMLYRLEEGSIKQPKPHLLKKVADALSIDYEKLLLKYDYITPGIQKKQKVQKQQKKVITLSDFISKKNKIIGSVECIIKESVDEIVQCDIDNLMPMAKKGDFLGLKKVKGYIANEIYIGRGIKSDVSLYIGKQCGEEVVLVSYPAMYNDTKLVEKDLYKLVFRHSDASIFTKEKIS